VREFDLICVAIGTPHHLTHQRGNFIYLLVVVRIKSHLPSLRHDIILLVVAEDLTVALSFLHPFLLCYPSFLEQFQLLRGQKEVRSRALLGKVICWVGFLGFIEFFQILVHVEGLLILLILVEPGLLETLGGPE